eukprot:TRINITY_DN65086_c0_g1_i1.p1 TRINITY_DN65086_c0_g1~~TRINITY_DN65086_c0_g1_i1.p1  ORF type:complete len:575 (+),score=80.79 TRINITY_DN65086_c0_g1_i1:103-1827(+)
MPPLIPRLSLSTLSRPQGGLLPNAGPPTERSVRWSDAEALTQRSTRSKDSGPPTERSVRWSDCEALTQRSTRSRESVCSARSSLQARVRRRRPRQSHAASSCRRTNTRSLCASSENGRSVVERSPRQGLARESCQRRRGCYGRGLSTGTTEPSMRDCAGSQQRCAGGKRDCVNSNHANDLLCQWAAEVAATPRSASTPASPRLPPALVSRRLGVPTPRTRSANFPGAGPELAAELLHRRHALQDDPLLTYHMETDDDDAAEQPEAEESPQRANPHAASAQRFQHGNIQRLGKEAIGESGLEVMELRLDLERIVHQVVRPLARHFRNEVTSLRRDLSECLHMRGRLAKRGRFRQTVVVATKKGTRCHAPCCQLDAVGNIMQQVEGLSASVHELQLSQDCFRQELANSANTVPTRQPVLWDLFEASDEADVTEGVADSEAGSEHYQSDAESDELIPAGDTCVDEGRIEPPETDIPSELEEKLRNMVRRELASLEQSFAVALERKADAIEVEDALQGHEAWMERLAGWLEQLRERGEAVRSLLRAVLPDARHPQPWYPPDAELASAAFLSPRSADGT